MTAQTIDPLPEVMPQYVADELRAMVKPLAKPHGSAGIACYWRVEPKRSRRHKGPFPLAVAPDTWIDVTLDPADLDTL